MMKFAVDSLIESEICIVAIVFSRRSEIFLVNMPRHERADQNGD
jgi:hypothetical protein